MQPDRTRFLPPRVHPALPRDPTRSAAVAPLCWDPVVACTGGALIGLESLSHLPGRPGTVRSHPARLLSATVAEAARWPDGLVFLALPPSWFNGPGLVATVAELLEQSGLDPARLQLAIPEQVLEGAREAVAFDLVRLRGLGIGATLDGFGAGQASLTTLRTVEFDRLRLAPELTRLLGRCRRAEAAVRSVLHFGKSLGLRVSAAGVDTEVQLGILQAYGCDEVQGLVVAPPSRGVPDLHDLQDRLARSPFFFAPPGPGIAGARSPN